MTEKAADVKTTGALAFAIAEHACQSIGPEGTVMKTTAEDAPLVRATFIARLAETATAIANGELK